MIWNLTQVKKTNAFLIETFSESVRFLIQALTKESKQVVAETKEFEYRDVSIMIVFFDSFGLPVL